MANNQSDSLFCVFLQSSFKFQIIPRRERGNELLSVGGAALFVFVLKQTTKINNNTWWVNYAGKRIEMSLAYFFLKPLVRRDLTSPSFLFVWRAAPAQAAHTGKRVIFWLLFLTWRQSITISNYIGKRMRKHCDDINCSRYSKLVLFTFIEYPSICFWQRCHENIDNLTLLVFI